MDKLKGVGVLAVGLGLAFGGKKISDEIIKNNQIYKEKVDYITKNTPNNGFNKDFTIYKVTGVGNETMGKIVSKMVVKNVPKEYQGKFMKNFYKTIKAKNKYLQEKGESKKIETIKKGDLIYLHMISEKEAFIKLNNKTIIFIDFKGDFIYV